MSQSTPTTSTNIVDVRQIPPRNRHPLIFQTFEDLANGEAFVLGHPEHRLYKTATFLFLAHIDTGAGPEILSDPRPLVISK
jgi:uncharacterized protein (DUF2249 family)